MVVWRRRRFNTFSNYFLFLFCFCSNTPNGLVDFHSNRFYWFYVCAAHFQVRCAKIFEFAVELKHLLLPTKFYYILFTGDQSISMWKDSRKYARTFSQAKRRMYHWLTQTSVYVTSKRPLEFDAMHFLFFHLFSIPLKYFSQLKISLEFLSLSLNSS